MSRMRLGDKVDRMVEFLFGMHNVRVGGPLAAHGFTQAELDNGWVLLRRVVGDKLGVPSNEPDDVEALDELDAWENHWFPIAKASLEGRMPEVAEKFFLNLAQTEGTEVVVSVSTFLTRLEDLEHGGSTEQEARQLLATRGLTPAVCAQARALLGKLESLQTPPTPTFEEVRAAQDAAEAAMWRWYLEWSAIARAAIKDPRVLQQLGFGSRNRRRSSGDEPSDGTPSPPPEAGAPPSNNQPT